MDVTRAGMSLAGMGGAQEVNKGAEAADRDQAMKNAMTALQAKYGEKPKEQRAVHKTLDKDDFLKIMITEMKHQDPTKPMDADKMATQLAQVTSVEQMRNVGASMDKLVEKNNSSDRLAMSAMIGKSVTVDKGKFSHTKGTISPLNYTLPENAAKVKVSILDEHGEEIFSRDVEPQKAGANVYNWDGVASNGTAVKAGAYAVRIEAENEQGKKIKIDPIERDTIIGVSFDGGDTNFLVGDPKQPQKVAMRNVVKIEGDSMMRPAVKAPVANAMGVSGTETDSSATETAPVAEAAAKAETAPKSDVPVSHPDGSFALPDSLKEKFQAKAEGFPNGLSDN